MSNKTDVYMREVFIGQVDSPEEFIKKVKQERREGKIPEILNINYNKDLNEIIVEVWFCFFTSDNTGVYFLSDFTFTVK